MHWGLVQTWAHTAGAVWHVHCVFDALSFLSSLVAIPVYVKHSISFKENSSCGRFDITIGPKQNMGKTIEGITVTVHMPKVVLNMNLTPTQGSYTFDPVTKVQPPQAREASKCLCCGHLVDSGPGNVGAREKGSHFGSNSSVSTTGRELAFHTASPGSHTSRMILLSTARCWFLRAESKFLEGRDIAQA